MGILHKVAKSWMQLYSWAPSQNARIFAHFCAGQYRFSVQRHHCDDNKITFYSLLLNGILKMGLHACYSLSNCGTTSALSLTSASKIVHYSNWKPIRLHKIFCAEFYPNLVLKNNLVSSIKIFFLIALL